MSGYGYLKHTGLRVHTGSFAGVSEPIRTHRDVRRIGPAPGCEGAASILPAVAAWRNPAPRKAREVEGSLR